jgi:hypothetical protein
MSVAHRFLAVCFATAGLISGAIGQDKPSQPASRAQGQVQGAPQDLEPAVDTSATPDDVQAKTAPGAATASAVKPVVHPAAPGQAKPKAGAKDRIELDTTQITGNRELPKVLYIVPWKRSDLSDLAGRPSNSLLDEVLMPVDRDVFKRENRYYGALNPDEPRRDPGAPGAPPAADAKSGAADAPRARDEK